MYLCSECKEIFDEPEYIRFDPSPDGISLGPGYMTDAVCPNCGSGYFDDYYEEEEEFEEV